MNGKIDNIGLGDRLWFGRDGDFPPSFLSFLISQCSVMTLAWRIQAPSDDRETFGDTVRKYF